MNVKEEIICRLCLKLAEDDFQIIDESTRKMFEVLLLRLNLDISKDPVICKDCAKLTEKCFNFKSVWIDTELKFSLPLDQNMAKFELEDVYKVRKDIETVDNKLICPFCSNHLRDSDFVRLDTLMSDITFAEMFQALMPKVDLSIIKNSIACVSCRQHLECYIKFAENCFDVENKITKYVQNRDHLSCAQIKLGDILYFSFKNVSDLDYTQIHTIKQEKNPLEDIAEAHTKVYDIEFIKVEQVLDIKVEDNLNETACEAPSEMPVYKIHPCSSKPKIRKARKESTIAKYKSKVNKMNKMPSTKDISEAQIFKCALCTFKTKYKGSLNNHMLIHKDITEVKMFYCSKCSYKSRYKICLERHMVIHKELTEVKMFKCSVCTFQTKQMCNLKKHALIHKDVTEIEMYKCSVCSFETKHKCSLKIHMVIHKDITEVEMYKCPTCCFETRHKGCLKIHMITHKDNTEVKMYKCSICTYETKYKRSVVRHMVTHKDIKVEKYMS